MRDVGRRVNEEGVITHKQENHLKGLLPKICHDTQTFSTSAFLYGQQNPCDLLPKLVHRKLTASKLCQDLTWLRPA